jgi:LPPG:FO 2-phospho-L-lactate transferase
MTYETKVEPSRILALAGGVGGARLAAGLARVLAPDQLTVVVNTGDDFEHLGLHVSPDIDTVTYTLAGISNAAQGWGLANETFRAMEAIRTLGGADWFALGDQDLATHILRTLKLRTQTLSEITAQFAQFLGVRHSIIPMSDDPVRSFIETDEGRLAFQEYFVRRRCAPIFRSIDFEGLDTALPSRGFLAALNDPGLGAIIICPSNPVLSIKPILDLPGIQSRMTNRNFPVIAVSPFIGGQAVKGPAAKIMAEIGLPASAIGLAKSYSGLIDGIVLDHADSAEASGIAPLSCFITDTLMKNTGDQTRLAGETLQFAFGLRPKAVSGQ